MKKPEFIAKYRAACLDLLNDHASALQINMGKAIDTQREIMEDANNPPQVRLNASNEILRYGLMITDRVSILAKLKKLEDEDDGD